MAIVTKSTLKVVQKYRSNRYGNVSSINTTTNEFTVDEISDIDCISSDIEVKFKYYNNRFEDHPKEYTINANKYAFKRLCTGIYHNTFMVYISDSTYLFVLTITTNKNKEIELDKGIFVEIYDLKDQETMLDKIKVEDVKIIV